MYSWLKDEDKQQFNFFRQQQSGSASDVEFWHNRINEGADPDDHLSAIEHLYLNHLQRMHYFEEVMSKYGQELNEHNRELELRNRLNSLLPQDRREELKGGNSMDLVIANKKRSQSARLSKLESDLQAMKRNFPNEAELELEKFKSFIQTQTGTVENSVVQITDAKTNAESIVDTISERALLGDHSDQADQEATTANTLRIIAGTLFLILAGLSFYGIYHAEVIKISWSTVGFRAGCAGAILLAAAYFARESTRHRNTSNQHKKITLGLNAIGPYTRNMPEQQRNEVLHQFALQVFSVESADTPQSLGQKVGVKIKKGDAAAEVNAESSNP